MTASVSIGFGMMCVGMFMAILDVQVVATSLPTIQSALAIPPDQMSWVQTAYLIAEVIAIPLTGFLTRAAERCAGCSCLAISVFTLASLGCAASESFAALIAWRILQGFSGGTLIPAVFSAVFLLFPVLGRAWRRHSPACWRCWRRPSVRSSAAGSRRPIPGIGCF